MDDDAPSVLPHVFANGSDGVLGSQWNPLPTWMRPEAGVAGGVMVWRRIFPGRCDQAPQARRFVSFLLADTDRVEDAEWITAELVSNALIHTRSGERCGRFTVEVALLPHQAAYVAVYDQGGGGPPDFASHSTEPEQYVECGRGLRGVTQLASRVGFRGSANSGHVVWVQLPLSGAREPERVAS